MPIVVQLDKCNGCETCLASCPFDAIDIKDGKAYINEYCNECKACLSVCPEGAIVEIESPESRVQSPAKTIQIADYMDVWVFAEQREGKTISVAYELLGIGKKLAEELENKLCAVLLGADKSCRCNSSWKVIHSACCCTAQDRTYS
jgi:electron transfer flavoprotein alpha subunit